MAPIKVITNDPLHADMCNLVRRQIPLHGADYNLSVPTSAYIILIYISPYLAPPQGVHNQPKHVAASKVQYISVYYVHLLVLRDCNHSQYKDRIAGTWSRALLEKLSVLQVVKEFFTYYLNLRSTEYSKGNKTLPRKMATTRTDDGHKKVTKTSVTV